MSTFRVPMSGVFIENRYLARALSRLFTYYLYTVNCKQNPIDKVLQVSNLILTLQRKNMVSTGVVFCTGQILFQNRS